MTATTETETAELAICTDCLLLLANGDTEGVAASEWHPDPETREDLRYRAPTPEEQREAEEHYRETTGQGWEGWNVFPGCPGCEWCRVCPRCGREEHEHPDLDPEGHDPETDGPYCPGPEGGWEGGWIETADGPRWTGPDRADDCPRDEGHFSWSGCDYCGMRLGATLYPASAWRRADR